jgi:hypothetical protein
MSEIVSETVAEIKPEEVATDFASTAMPPRLFARNGHGLIRDGSIKYVYDSDGLVNWRAMIDPKYLAINKSNFEKRQRPIPDSIIGLEDKDLLILLPGVKKLSQVRGYDSVTYSVVSPSKDYVVATCEINWIPNYETENKSIKFSAIGDASPENTTSFGKNYLGPIAENRAFVRAVRNFLKINIVSQEELGQNAMSSDSNTIDPSLESMLAVMDAFGITFEKIKATLIKDGFPDADKLERLSDIPAITRFSLVGRIKKKAKEKAVS